MGHPQGLRPGARQPAARIARLAGYAAVLALALVKAHVGRLGYTAVAGHPMLAGVWAGEILYLVVVAAYVTGLLAVTARRLPAGPAALAVGAGAGALAGLVMYALPLRTQPHIANGWLGWTARRGCSRYRLRRARSSWRDGRRPGAPRSGASCGPRPAPRSGKLSRPDCALAWRER